MLPYFLVRLGRWVRADAAAVLAAALDLGLLRTFEAADAAFALVTSGLRAIFKSLHVLDAPSESSYKNLRNRRYFRPKTSPEGPNLFAYDTVCIT